MVFWSGMAFLGLLQVMAVVLNLLPIPALDGYGALEPHLSPGPQRTLDPLKQYGFFILLFLLIAPPLNRWFFDAGVQRSSRRSAVPSHWRDRARSDAVLAPYPALRPRF